MVCRIVVPARTTSSFVVVRSGRAVGRDGGTSGSGRGSGGTLLCVTVGRGGLWGQGQRAFRAACAKPWRSAPQIWAVHCVVATTLTEFYPLICAFSYAAVWILVLHVEVPVVSLGCEGGREANIDIAIFFFLVFFAP